MDRRHFFGAAATTALMPAARPRTQIVSIQVSAGRTFNHPYEQFSNFRPEVTLTAMVPEGCDVARETERLQNQAETLCETQKQRTLSECKLSHESLWENRDRCYETEFSEVPY